MVQFETNRYSVPVKYIGERVTIRASVDQIEILLGHEQIAVHPRKYGRIPRKSDFGSLSGTPAHEIKSTE
jgi:hypothetical protein